MDELRTALELATEEELQQITNILFCRRFNPLDYLRAPDAIAVQSQDWDSWLDSVEDRFRYLAADGVTVLKGQTEKVSYRQILVRVCHFLKVPYSQKMPTTEIEAEIYLHLVNKAWKRLPPSEQKSLSIQIQKALADSHTPQPLPVHLQHNPLDIVLKGGSVIAINSILKPILLKHIAGQFALHFARYQGAKTALVQGGTIVNQIALQTAKQGMTRAAARYGAVRTVLSLVGPALWGWFIADLGWKAIATDYGRIIPTIFALAQIRLTRDDCWQPA
ncbi:YaaW family protein [Microcystis aeruginosa]|uniref:YaaW family protein n=1 Tax=Microcystis aeruginosa TaxID=1126 RepID=UPI00046A6D7E|nr:YaaW family protein [Microcystis aeruginosa]MDB9396929.1 YaaW family protein [Microcystis aeruginosa CS-573]